MLLIYTLGVLTPYAPRPHLLIQSIHRPTRVHPTPFGPFIYPLTHHPSVHPLSKACYEPHEDTDPALLLSSMKAASALITHYQGPGSKSGVAWHAVDVQ